ncbi:hypothetical protein [Microbacterium luticocti]|uniref:hypothetical protein n=1 Tax=Microbacterium luticocti TaxID=451764 RepID=UPI00040D9A50|nr:hypothetical protein [Microbacterium luticocti]
MLRTRRRVRLWAAPLWRLNTWMLLGAAAVVGFEGLEALLGTFLMAPELLPFALLALALYWVFRERVVRGVRRLRIRIRAARARRCMRRADAAATAPGD